MRRCMVKAGKPLLRLNTLAARPVGASSIIFCLRFLVALAMAPASEVFPVPALPRNIIALRSLPSRRNSWNMVMA